MRSDYHRFLSFAGRQSQSDVGRAQAAQHREIIRGQRSRHCAQGATLRQAAAVQRREAKAAGEQLQASRAADREFMRRAAEVRTG